MVGLQLLYQNNFQHNAINHYSSIMLQQHLERIIKDFIKIWQIYSNRTVTGLRYSKMQVRTCVLFYFCIL